MVAPLILVEATPRRATDGVAVTVRLAGGGGELPYFYGDQHWRAGIAGLPNTIAALDFDGEQLGGSGVPQAMELRWSPGSSAAIEELQALYWADAPVTVRIGPEGALPPVEVAGLAVDAAVQGGTLALALSDQAADLRRSVLVDRFAGTGGIEGPAEWADLIRSRAWGRCFNVPGRLLDRAHQVWCFGDPARAWLSFDAVRDKGVAPAASALTVLAWQGSVAATFAALQSAPVVEGGGVSCPSIACVKWWAEPAGDLRADVRGETAGGYVETAPEIAQRIVAARSALAFAVGAVAAAAAVRPAPCGWRIDSDATTAIDAISDLLAGVSMSWVIVDGSIEFRRWEWTAPTRIARSERVTRHRTFKPVTARKLGYRRNCAPMARGDLAAVVFVQDVVYDDGTPLTDAIATGSNAVFNSGFARDTYGFISNGGGGLSLNLPGYFGKRQVAYKSYDTGFGGSVGQDRDVTTLGYWLSGSVTDMVRYCLPVKAGERLAARTLAAGHRCDVQLWILVFDKNGTLVQPSAPAPLNTAGGGSDGDNFTTLQHTATITHPDAAYAQWMLRAKSNGQGGTEQPFIFFAEPWFAKIALNQVALPPYSIGPADPVSDQTSTSVVLIELVTDRTIAADYQGSLTGPLPVIFSPTVRQNNASLKLLDSTSYTLVDVAGGAVSVSSAAGAGDKGDVAVTGMSADKVTFTLIVTVAGVNYGPYRCSLTKQRAAPPASSTGGGSGGTSIATIPTDQNNATTSYASAHSAAPLTVVLQAGQKLYGTYSADYFATGIGNRSGEFLAKYSANEGASWSAFGPSVIGAPAMPGRNSGGEFIEGNDGHVELIQNVAGLSAGNYRCRLSFRSSFGGRNVGLHSYFYATFEAKP